MKPFLLLNYFPSKAFKVNIVMLHSRAKMALKHQRFYCSVTRTRWTWLDSTILLVNIRSRPDPLPVTSDLLIFLPLSLIFPPSSFSSSSLVLANWIVSLQMVLEASPCKLDAPPFSPPHPFLLLFFSCTHSPVLMCARTPPLLIQTLVSFAACSHCVSKVFQG